MGNFFRLFGTEELTSIFTRFKLACLLSLLFIGVYSACNQLSSIRSDVGELYLAWEVYIPLIPLFIIPYMSIDLLFFGAPFLCKQRQELIVFSKRIALGILIAAAFFLLMPLKFAFERPVLEGWLGVIFAFLHSFDQPYNLFPSLHIILRTILAHQYAQKTRGWLKAIVHLWFVLIGLSTIFTYQHHVLDIVSGFVVGVLVIYSVREKPLKLPTTRNLRIATYYFLLTLVSFFLVYRFFPIAIPAIWLVITFVIVCFGYIGGGYKIINKVDGKIDTISRIVLAPWLWGQWLSLLYYSKRCDAWNKVSHNIWIGRLLTEPEVQRYQLQTKIHAVVDLTCEFSEAQSFIDLNEQYLNEQVLDLTAPSVASLQKIVQFMMSKSQDGVVYVHCKIGYSRSVAAVAAYLLYSGEEQSIDEAINRIKQARPSVVVRPEIWQVLQRFQLAITTNHKENKYGIHL